MRRASTTLATIKKNLTPSKKSKKDKGHASNRHRRRGGNDDDGSVFSSSASSSEDSFDDESSYSSLSGSGSKSSGSSSASSSLEKYSRSRKSKDHDRRYRRSRRDDKRRHNKDKRRSRRSRRDRDRYPSNASGYSTPQPQRHVNPTISNDEATQMVDLLMRILPFYGRGDGHSDAVVVDTIHRLPPQALETQDIDGNTLLMLACQAGAFDLLPALLAKGCNVNMCNNVGAGCLHYACFTDSFSPDAAMTLIRHGAIAERIETEFGCSPLHWASFSGHIELCTALCRAGANPLTLDKNGCDPIYYAMENGHGGCATLLKTFSENTATTAPSTTSSTEWVRCLDHTGTSFYHNNETGESLWGDDFRKVDESVTVANLNHVQNSAGVGESKENEGDTDIDTNSVSNTGARDGKTPKVTEETALSPIAEDTTGNEQLESHHLAEIIEDAIEAASVEGDQPDQIDNEDDKATKEKKDNVPPLQQHSVKADTSSAIVSNPSISNNNETDTHSESTVLLARNESFEARISSLHQRMETQLMDRLQHLEDKIAKQNFEASISTKAANDDDTSKTNENIAQVTSTILQLQTEQGKKDLEILSLKQQILTLETEKISQHKTSMSVGIGDGDIFLSANANNYEQELTDEEIVKLKEDVVVTKQSLDTANERYEQAQRNTEISEQLARDEKAARLKSLEEINKSAAEKSLSQSLQEELRHSEEIIVQMKARIRTIEDSTTEEKRNYSQQLAQLQSQEVKLVNELEMTVTDIQVMKDHHKSELSQTKEDLENVHSELEGMRGQTREAKMAKMEMLLAKDEAELAKDEALEKARVATRKLKEMTDFVNKATELKAVNDRLHISLQDETEKRKVLHNNLEDLKGRIRVYVRVRPLSSSEMKANYANVLTKEDDRTSVMSSDAAIASDVRDWEFDKIFSGSAHDGNTQEAIFKDTSLLITSAIDGFNVCIFAYGQTGSGKTYTSKLSLFLLC